MDNIYEKAVDLILTYGPKLVGAILVWIIGSIVVKFLSNTFGRILDKRKVDPSLKPFLTGIVSSLLKVMLVISVLGMVGIEMTSFVAILGAAGLAVGLALQGSLSNFASGVLIIILRPFKSGEFIEAAGHSGSVSKIEIFSTELLSPDNKTIIVPNSAIMGGAIVNYSRQERRRVDIMVGVSYDSCLKQTREVLENVIKSNDKVLKDPEFFIGVHSLGDSSVNFVTRSWAKTEDYWAVYFYLQENFKLALDEADITIPFPQMDVHLNKISE
jgi:small conductance mechanosensitive channel